MSQHNIIGSEAFDRKPFVLVGNFRTRGTRRRRSALTYLIVAVIALCIGAAVAAFALGPQLVAGSQAVARTTSGLPVTAPAVPGTTTTTTPEAASSLPAAR